MINLVSIAPKQVTPRHISEEDYIKHCGMFTSPRHRNPIKAVVALGARWAADNDCFKDYQPERIHRYLIRWQEYAPTCLFFNAPDVIKDAAATLERFEIWEPILKGLGWPVAFTVQNGMQDYVIPWARINALFIGSSNDVKYSPYMAGVIQEAKKRRLWVHNGRVGGRLVIDHSLRMGCDSFDGSGFTMNPKKVGQYLAYHNGQFNQLNLFGDTL